MTDETSEPDFSEINESISGFAPDDLDQETVDMVQETVDMDQETVDLDQERVDLDQETVDMVQETVDLDQDTVDALDEAQQAMADARSRLADVPADVVVTNHVMGLYELAAIHLSATPPDLVQSALAIDAVACLVDGLGDRLGDDASTMRDALNNIRLAFVQIKGAAPEPT